MSWKYFQLHIQLLKWSHTNHKIYLLELFYYHLPSPGDSTQLENSPLMVLSFWVNPERLSIYVCESLYTNASETVWQRFCSKPKQLEYKYFYDIKEWNYFPLFPATKMWGFSIHTYEYDRCALTMMGELTITKRSPLHSLSSS